jgi:hypothetical protein
MNKTRSRRAELLAAVLTPLLGLGGCSGDADDPRKIDGLVTIQMPTSGATFGPTPQDTINIFIVRQRLPPIVPIRPLVPTSSARCSA